ncbi:MAG: LLM class flavin-dependent oxidoreductase [Chloroflexota bacterium]|nr:LLM class flavin-dependent oxidoreductase [Dehalococcoidia bacterium]MDW8255059.1 LLM class flavin-dependent oxidoreductase [Chloroflexota bacterium]
MKIGIAASLRIKAGASWDEAVDYLTWLAWYGDTHGYANLWMTEHHFTEQAGAGSPAVMLGYLAARTSRLRLGGAVMLVPFYHPIRLAEELLLVDRLSQGRLDIGIGRGHSPLETAVLCPDPDRAVELFEDGVAVLEAAFRGESFRFDGAYWRFPEIRVFPPPVQRRGEDGSGPPFYMPVTSPRSIEFAARHGIIPLVGYREPRQATEALKQYAAAARAAGHDEARIAWLLERVATNRFVLVADTRAEAEALTRAELAYPSYSHWMYGLPVGDPRFQPLLPESLPPLDVPADELAGVAIFGTRDDVIDQIRALEAVGVRHLSVAFSFRSSPEVSRERVERFTREVLPYV